MEPATYAASSALISSSKLPRNSETENYGYGDISNAAVKQFMHDPSALVKRAARVVCGRRCIIFTTQALIRQKA